MRTLTVTNVPILRSTLLARYILCVIQLRSEGIDAASSHHEKNAFLLRTCCHGARRKPSSEFPSAPKQNRNTRTELFMQCTLLKHVRRLVDCAFSSRKRTNAQMECRLISAMLAVSFILL